MKRIHIFKFVSLVALIVTVFLLFRYTSLGILLSKEHVTQIVNESGMLGPVLFVLVFALGTMFFLPGSIFIAIGAILFGTYVGTLLNIIGHLFGAIAAFFLVKFLGRDFVKGLGLHAIKEYDGKFRKHGFATVFYLRLCFCPFAILNIAAGLSAIRFWQFFWGTLMGMIVPIFIMTFFVDAIAAVRTFNDLLTPNIFFALALFLFALCIPALLKFLPVHIKKKIGVPVDDGEPR